MASRRKGRRGARARVEKRITRKSLREGRRELGISLYADLEQLLEAERPQRRADCVDGPRPCPWAACKHHLYLDVNSETGSIKINHPDVELWELPETCALDVAEGVRGQGMKLEDVGQRMNVTRERIRQVVAIALDKVRAALLDDQRDE